MASPLSLSKYILLYSNLYILCFFGLAASVVLWARGELFCRFVAPAGFRLLNGKVAGRQVDSGAPVGISRREAEAEQAQGPAAVSRREAKAPNIYINTYALLNIFQDFCLLVFSYLHVPLFLNMIFLRFCPHDFSM